MTLPPNDDSFQVKGVKGPKYKVGPRCCNPSCSRYAEHAHHLWRRSLLKGPFHWAQLPDGQVVGNLVALCVNCHDRVTGRLGGHKNAIRLAIVSGKPTFFWSSVEEWKGEVLYTALAPIDPQPPSPDLPDEVARTETEACPMCGQARRRRSLATRDGESSPSQGERRRRKSWTLLVPDDDEDGATVLDALVQTLAPVVGVEPDQGGRYYIVVAALAHAHHDIPSLTHSLAGKG